MTIPSLKEKATLANVVHLRSQLFEKIDRIISLPLTFFTQLGEDRYNINLVILDQIVDDMKRMKEDWNSDWHDSGRWKTIILNNINEAEHFQSLLDTSFSEHFSSYHSTDSHCPCWNQLIKDLKHEIGYLRSRLF